MGVALNVSDGSSSPLSSTSGHSSLGSSWTPRGPQYLQPSPPNNKAQMGGVTVTLTRGGVGGAGGVANITEAEALLQLSHCQESDEGIVSDQSSVADPEDPAAARRIKVRQRGRGHNQLRYISIFSQKKHWHGFSCPVILATCFCSV